MCFLFGSVILYSDFLWVFVVGGYGVFRVLYVVKLLSISDAF